MTRSRFLLPAALLFAALPLSAQSTGSCAAPPSMPLKASSSLDIESRSAEIEIVGTEREEVRISCSLKHQDRAAKIKVQFSAKNAASGALLVKGGPKNGVSIHIEVPIRTNLKLHATAGEWKVFHVIGDKDIRLSFGDVTVAPVLLREYGSVEASTRIGEVHVPGGISKKQFFESFSSTASQEKFHLAVHVTTGDIDLKSEIP